MGTLFIRDWPEDVNKELRREALERGVGLREILLEAVTVWKASRKKSKRKK